MTGDPAAVAAVQTTRLGRRYGQVWGLRDCTLDVPAGRTVALVGASAALFRSRAGEDSPRGGTPPAHRLRVPPRIDQLTVPRPWARARSRQRSRSAPS